MIVSTYVDDFIILTPTNKEIDQIIRLLTQDLEVKNLGNIIKFIGVEI